MRPPAPDRFLGIETPLQRIPSLDGLRAISICLVLLSHTLVSAGYGQIWRVTGNMGELGVRIFFVISGFLITTLLLHEYRRTGSISLRWFYYRRTMRIFPAFYFFVAAIAAATILGILAVPARDFAFALTYTMNFVAEPEWALGHLWSLAVEEQFYLLWPVTLALLGVRRGMKVAFAVVLVTPLVRFACLYSDTARPLIGLAFPTIADPLAIGCLLAGAREWLGSQPRYIAFLRWRGSALAAPAVLLLNAMPGTKLNMLVTQSLVNIAIALVIDRWTRFPDGRAGRVLNWLPLRGVGVLSYSLYLWQQPFLTPHALGPLTRFPLNLVAAFAFAYFSYRVVEKPCLDLRGWLENRWKSRRRAEASAGRSAAEPAPAGWVEQR